MSRIRDPQRLVELVLDTMAREATRAESVRALNGSAESPAPTQANDDRERGD